MRQHPSFLPEFPFKRSSTKCVVLLFSIIHVVHFIIIMAKSWLFNVIRVQIPAALVFFFLSFFTDHQVKSSIVGERKWSMPVPCCSLVWQHPMTIWNAILMLCSCCLNRKGFSCDRLESHKAWTLWISVQPVKSPARNPRTSLSETEVNSRTAPRARDCAMLAYLESIA